MNLLLAFALVAAVNAPADTPPPVSPSPLAPALGPQASVAALPLHAAMCPYPAIREIDQAHHPDQRTEAQTFFLHQRLPPGETSLNIERYAAAREHMQSMPQHSTQKAAPLPRDTSTWTPLGPGNVGGRTLALVIDPGNPRTIYAGTADGGIWKTTDAGMNWRPIGDFLPSLAIGSLAMDPSNSSILYAGTGEGSFSIDAVRGAGVFQTTDAGDIWVQVPGTGTPDFYYVNKVVISSVSHQIYAATGTGVWNLDPASGQWTQTFVPNSNILGGCFDLALVNDSSGNDVLTAACGTFVQGGIFQNPQVQTAGSPWGLVYTRSAMGRTALAVAPSDPNIIYAITASNLDGPNHSYNQGLLGVFRSEQGGAAGTWHPQLLNTSKDLQSTLLLTNPVFAVLQACGSGPSAFINQGWYDITIAVDPTNPYHVFVGGIDLFRSDDGGMTFGAASYWWAHPDSSYNHSNQHALAFDPGYDGAANQVLYIGNDGGVFRTTDALAQTAAGPVVLLCNDANSKISYTALNHSFAATPFYSGAVFPDGTAYFGGTKESGTVLGSDSAGANAWISLLEGGIGGNVSVDPTAANTLYASNAGLSLKKSVDSGKSFSPAVAGIVDYNFQFIAPFIMDPSNPHLLWTGGRYLWRTTNGAKSWSRASARIAGSPEASVSAIASSPANSNYLLAGTDEGIILRNNAAVSGTGHRPWPWGMPRLGYVSSLTFDPSNTSVAYATYSTFGGTHVWKTADGGATWTGIDGTGKGALPDLPVNSIIVDPAKPTNLYIGTDMGVFVSTDNGQSWAIELTGLPNAVVDALVLHGDQANGRSLYAFTLGRGVWRVNLP